MVHKTQDNNKVAVIGFLYKLGEPNSFITKVNSNKHICVCVYPVKPSTRKMTGYEINGVLQISGDKTYHFFD